MARYNLITTCAILAVFVSGNNDRIDVNFEHLTTFRGLSDDSGITQSCIYDPVNGLWRFFDQNMNGEVDSLPNIYPFYPLNNGFIQGRQSVGNGTSSGVTGQVFVQTEQGNFLYIADSLNGIILKYNVDTEQLIEDDKLDTGKIGVNGLCYDKKRNMLYATNADTSNIMKFNLNNAVPFAETIYFSGDPLINQFGNIAKEVVTGQDYVFRPNECTVKDDMVYFVETRLDLSGHLLIYNIEKDEFLLNTQILSVTGYGMLVSSIYFHFCR